MFLKLMKHELKATAKLQLILAGSLLGVSLLAAGLLYFLWDIETSSIAVDILGVLALPVLLLSAVAYGVAASFLAVYRFYKHKFTDEGYLTFTLPVSTDQLIWSSYLCLLLWALVIGLVSIGSLALVLNAVLHTISEDGMDLFTLLGGTWAEIWNVQYMDAQLRSYVILSIVGSVVSMLAWHMVVMMAICLGAAAAKKHKLLAAFGIGYGISIALTTLQTSVTLSMDAAMQLPLWAAPAFQTVLYLALGVGSYLTVRFFMGKRLNLN